MTDNIQDNQEDAFAGIARLYGTEAYALIRKMHVCVVGIGGVGSWVVEALARSAVGKITMIDYDTIAESNINRQIHTLSGTIEQKKCTVMQQRVKEINPACEVNIIDDFITLDNMFAYISQDYDYVVDAIDSIKFKAGLIYHCKRNKIPVITTGGAGGLTDPSVIKVVDLSKTYNDALAAKVRSTLREQYNFSKNSKRSFGIDCVFSSQQQLYPKEDGSVSHQKPGIHGVSLDCRFGYGAASFVTGTFGFIAAAHIINKFLSKQSKV
ncbi:MAG: tRNA cyclic N6-threonylcarbamoyladenosine(37) synthase TcdA [Gammaproteobacteria bacterium]|nr:tRNA cyclic N6-threonylcarbamoyladenosine(37) synthase TcdA [Gammaproteobacteria bacterium]MCW8988650.1 tRNA cyclic N6-threonylcarbamoyladenosine(37) synthase TcdA [Gammaproteobacteria bacterium]MCW9030746.1 tRNA cyclic N6-threonylcarbamoyladenosine(37) synthase TcdA [Gammaproteobacteria bacterium]